MLTFLAHPFLSGYPLQICRREFSSLFAMAARGACIRVMSPLPFTLAYDNAAHAVKIAHALLREDYVEMLRWEIILRQKFRASAAPQRCTLHILLSLPFIAAFAFGIEEFPLRRSEWRSFLLNSSPFWYLPQKRQSVACTTQSEQAQCGILLSEYFSLYLGRGVTLLV